MSKTLLKLAKDYEKAGYPKIASKIREVRTREDMRAVCLSVILEMSKKDASLLSKLQDLIGDDSDG